MSRTPARLQLCNQVEKPVFALEEDQAWGEVVIFSFRQDELEGVVGRVMAPQDIQVLISGACACYLIRQKHIAAVNT